MKKKIIIIIAILILLGGIGYLLWGFLNNDNKDLIYEDYIIYKDTIGRIEDYDKQMTIDGLKEGEKAYYITGTISAKKDKQFSVITFNLYDKKNKLLGTAVAGLNKLEKDKKYDFKAAALLDESKINQIDHYELNSVKLGN